MKYESIPLCKNVELIRENTYRITTNHRIDDTGNYNQHVFEIKSIGIVDISADGNRRTTFTATFKIE